MSGKVTLGNFAENGRDFLCPKAVFGTDHLQIASAGITRNLSGQTCPFYQ